jgi:hypothetical protein
LTKFIDISCLWLCLNWCLSFRPIATSSLKALDSMVSFFLLLLLLLLPLFPFASCQLHIDNSLSLSLPFTSATADWDVYGAAALYSDTVVLTPHSPSHLQGALWSKKPNPHTYWEAEFSIRAMGAERGGIGLAFWYTTKRGLGGNVFGSVDQWDGLGLFFDSNTGGKVQNLKSACLR